MSVGRAISGETRACAIFVDLSYLARHANYMNIMKEATEMASFGFVNL